MAMLKHSGDLVRSRIGGPIPLLPARFVASESGGRVVLVAPLFAPPVEFEADTLDHSLGRGLRESERAADPFMGTWKLNLAKSSYKPGPAPRSVVFTVEPAGQGLRASGDA